MSTSVERPLRFVAVHLGAGSSEKTKSLEFAKKICEDVMLQDGNTYQPFPTCKQCEIPSKRTITAETSVVQLVKLMEDNEDLNCGLGSNLNMDGRVECDAGLMFDGKWSGVGAISGCRNPILFAKSLHNHQSIKRPLELMQPNFLVSSGAKQWMRIHCHELSVPDSHLISTPTLARYQKHKSRYDSAIASQSGSVKKQRLEPQEEEETPLDTVGAIAVDCDWNFAAAVSSGGISLKYKGRLGQSSVPGAGCWVGDNVAVVTTGVGEYLTQNLVAKSVCDDIQYERIEVETCDEELDDDEDMWPEKAGDFSQCVRNYIPGRGKDGDLSKKQVGLLAVNTYMSSGGHVGPDEPKLYFHYGHNTSNMCIGYMTSEDQTGYALISDKKDRDTVIKTLVL